jgi:hypothetical protein
MTPTEVAERYKGRITERTLANWRSSRQGPPFCKVGGRVFYKAEDLIEWESKRTVTIK